MEVRILGKIKSDGYRFLAKLYRLIINAVQETGSVNLNSEDKGYVQYFCRKLNQFELLKRKKHKLLCLVSGYMENTRRFFKRDVFHVYFDEPKGDNTIDNYDRYYQDRMRFTGEGVDLLAELAVVSSQVRKLVKYYNAMFYKEACPDYTKSFCENLIKETDFKAFNDNELYDYLGQDDDFSKMNEVSMQAVAENISLTLIGKIMNIHEANDNYPDSTVRILKNSEKNQKDSRHISQQNSSKMGVIHSMEEWYQECLEEEKSEARQSPNDYLNTVKVLVESAQKNPDNKVFLPPEIIYDFERSPTDDACQSKLDEDVNELIELGDKIEKTEILFIENSDDPHKVLFYYLIRLKFKKMLIKKRLLLKHSFVFDESADIEAKKMARS